MKTRKIKSIGPVGSGRRSRDCSKREDARQAAAEFLEPRRLLANIVVTTAGDDSGNVTPALLSGSTYTAQTLRDAIAFANSQNTTDTITFASPLFSTPQAITETDGKLSITNTAGLTIQGPGAGLLNVSGDNANRVIEVEPSAIATIDDLTITDGNFSSGGGIGNGGTVSLDNDVLTQCVGLEGGGIGNFALCKINNSTISGNITSDYQGQYLSPETGAGIANNGGELYISNSTISGNTSANGSGGGINSSGLLSMANSSIAGNSASYGGGIYASNLLSNSSSVTITDCTVARNSATGSSAVPGGGIRTGLAAGQFHINGTIVYGNTQNAVPSDIGSVSAIDSGSNNLVGADDTGDFVNGAKGNIVGADPLLGPLKDNGGPTQTIALLPKSPAIGAGAVFDGVDGKPISTDQRGVARPSNPDIGALQSHAAPTFVSSQVGNGAAQRSSLTRFQVLFDEAVSITASSFTVYYETAADNQAAQQGATPQFTALSNTADISFSSPDNGTTWVFSPVLGGAVDRNAGKYASILADGVYRLVLHGSAIADMATGTFQFNGGTDYTVGFNDGTGTAHTDFSALFGDLSGNGIVNNLDVAKLRTAFTGGTTTYNPALDFRRTETLLSNLDIADFRKRFLMQLAV